MACQLAWPSSNLNSTTPSKITIQHHHWHFSTMLLLRRSAVQLAKRFRTQPPRRYESSQGSGHGEHGHEAHHAGPVNEHFGVLDFKSTWQMANSSFSAQLLHCVSCRPSCLCSLCLYDERPRLPPSLYSHHQQLQSVRRTVGTEKRASRLHARAGSV